MKKYVVVSTNNNKDYQFFIPFVERAWASYGWDLCVMVTHDVDVKTLLTNRDETIIVQLPKIEGLRDATVAQASRLYAANYLPKDSLIMTSDMDLIPLSDYWHPSPDNITVYGHDLTWHSYYPMGYVSMTGENWTKYLQCSMNTERDMLRDAKEVLDPASGLPIAYSGDWEKWWNFDWQLLTNRLRPSANAITFIDRGQVNIANATLAKGRIDRHNIAVTRQQPDLIDMHAHNTSCTEPARLSEFLDIYESIHGKL